jgi:hypothetical protein
MGLSDHMDSPNQLDKDSPNKIPDDDPNYYSIIPTSTPELNASKKLLIYPFIAGDLVEKAAKGLFLGEDPMNCSSVHLLQLQQEKASQKNHHVSMEQEDIDRLQPDQWLDDSIVDFWMLWITRKEPTEENWIHIFNTQFYTALDDFGVEHVLNWTAKKKLDVFTKKMLILPINHQLHWSLCCVGNPSAVINSTDDDEAEDMEVSFILFLDPLDYHNKSMICDKVRHWLNLEWNRKYKNKIRIFSAITMKCFSPKGKTI